MQLVEIVLRFVDIFLPTPEQLLYNFPGICFIDESVVIIQLAIVELELGGASVPSPDSLLRITMSLSSAS